MRKSHKICEHEIFWFWCNNSSLYLDQLRLRFRLAHHRTALRYFLFSESQISGLCDPAQHLQVLAIFFLHSIMVSITNILVPLASVTPNIQVLPIFFVLSHNQKYLGSRDGHEYFSDSQRDLQEPSSTPGPSFVFLSLTIHLRLKTEKIYVWGLFI